MSERPLPLGSLSLERFLSVESLRLLDLSSLRRLGLSILDIDDEDAGCLLSVPSRFLLASSLLLVLVLLALLLPLVSARRLVLLLLLLLEALSLFSVDVDKALVLLAALELGELVLGGGGGAILISTGGAGSSKFKNLFLLTHFSL